MDAAILAIEKQFGRGSIMKLGSAERQSVDSIPTGSIALDLALGVGGMPRGRITEIFGPESSGKTTVCQHVIAEAQRRGGIAAFIDVEHALDPAYARACGVNVDELLVSQPDTGEQALEITETLIRSGGMDIVVVDSVAALVPRAEIEGEMGDSFVGIQARLMSQALRKLTGAVSRSNTALMFTNQLREKIGVMFGNPETTPGGRALKFYASVRLDIRRIETIKTGTESVGNRVRVKVVKNKVSPPFRVAEFDVMYGEGISVEGGLLDVGVAMDVVTKTGAWFTFDETRLGQGREASRSSSRPTPTWPRDRPPDPGQDGGRGGPGRGHRGGRVAGRAAGAERAQSTTKGEPGPGPVRIRGSRPRRSVVSSGRRWRAWARCSMRLRGTSRRVLAGPRDGRSSPGSGIDRARGLGRRPARRSWAIWMTRRSRGSGWRLGTGRGRGGNGRCAGAPDQGVDAGLVDDVLDGRRGGAAEAAPGDA